MGSEMCIRDRSLTMFDNVERCPNGFARSWTCLVCNMPSNGPPRLATLQSIGSNRLAPIGQSAGCSNRLQSAGRGNRPIGCGRLLGWQRQSANRLWQTFGMPGAIDSIGSKLAETQSAQSPQSQSAQSAGLLGKVNRPNRLNRRGLADCPLSGQPPHSQLFGWTPSFQIHPGPNFER